MLTYSVQMSLSLCRCCLSSDTHELIGIKESNYEQRFMQLIGLTVEEYDGLPKTICTECANMITEFTIFREKVLHNHSLLVAALEKKAEKLSPVESEIDDDAGDIEAKEEDTLQIETFDLHSPQNIKSIDKLYVSVNILHKRKKKKIKVKSTSKQSVKSKSQKSRFIIELDPNKISTIRLSEEEQRRRHEIEAKSPAFLMMPHKCMKCYKGFNYERKLQDHVDRCHKEGAKFVCKICSRTLGKSSTLSLHTARHEILYQCCLCLTTWVEKKQAIVHYERAHEDIHKTVSCTLCGLSFRHRSTLYGHMRSRHPSQERPVCNDCGKSFVSKDSLADHLLIHTGEKPYACYCGKTFRVKSELVVHSHSHTSKLFRCVPCDKYFKTDASYKSHIKFSKPHVNQDLLRKYWCDICSRGFAARWLLLKHKAQHSGAATYECDTCGTKLLSRSGLRRHIRKIHLHIPAAKNHICHTCGKRFAGRLMLENHIRTHTGEKPFICNTELCTARFSQKSTLRTHIKLVHLKIKRKTKIKDQITAKLSSEDKHMAYHDNF